MFCFHQQYLLLYMRVVNGEKYIEAQSEIYLGLFYLKTLIVILNSNLCICILNSINCMSAS